jgi:hypothetical protein
MLGNDGDEALVLAEKGNGTKEEIPVMAAAIDLLLALHALEPPVAPHAVEPPFAWHAVKPPLASHADQPLLASHARVGVGQGSHLQH